MDLTKVTLALLLASIYSIGSTQNIQWEENFGSTNSDHAWSTQKTSDGGYVLAGYSDSSDGDVSDNNGGRDCWVLKLDESRNIQWEQNYGGSKDESIQTIQQTHDGGYIFAGNSESSDGDVSGNYGGQDYWIVKLDESGNIEWEGNYGGSEYESVEHVEQTNDSGYVIAGSTRSADKDVSDNNGNFDAWVVKINNSGTIQWEENYGGSLEDFAEDIHQTEDGGYALLAGASSIDGNISHGDKDYWLIKLSPSGNIEWEENYGGSRTEFATSLIQTPDNGYVMFGSAGSSDHDVSANNGGQDLWILKVNQNGDIGWETNYGGSKDEYPQSIQQTSDGGYIVAGATQSSDGDVSENYGGNDYWVLKLTKFGTLEWEQNYGGSEDDYPSAVLQTANGNYLVAGGTRSSDRDVSSNHGDSDFWLLGLSNSTSIGPQTNADKKLNLYPNPANEQLTIETTHHYPASYMLYNATGQKAKSGNFRRDGSQTLDVSNLSPGIYLLKIKSKDGIRTRKVVIE